VKPILVRNLQIYAPKNAVDFVEYIGDNPLLYIAINAEKIIKDDPKLVGIINQNVGYPDGVGAVMCLRRKGEKEAIKIPGCELWLRVIKRFYHEKTFCIVGATDLVIDYTVYKLRREFPKIKIVHYRNGYFNNPTDTEELKNKLLEVSPDFVFVAQGSPNQEYLMHELFQAYPACYLGLGGSLDVYTKMVNRAPDLFLNLNLEWLYRLLIQPRRISRHIRLLTFLKYYLTNEL
jgi:UDP-N-acetyl-D-mannosaminouronate:lipid I N-acetyl-D-mannosaminouronosyltransferase